MQSRKQGSERRKLGQPQSENIAGSGSIQIHAAYVGTRAPPRPCGCVGRTNERIQRGRPGKLKHHLSNYNRPIGLSSELFRFVPHGSRGCKVAARRTPRSKVLHAAEGSAIFASRANLEKGLFAASVLVSGEGRARGGDLSADR